MSKVELERLIVAAFAETQLPAECFREVDLRGDIPHELQNRICGKSWTTVALSDWMMISSSAAVVAYFLTPCAMKYYVPSIIMASLSELVGLDFAVEALLPPNQKHLPKGNWKREFLLRFKPDETRAVVKFLHFVINEAPEASIASALAGEALTIYKGL